jgi:hypothetical protein
MQNEPPRPRATSAPLLSKEIQLDLFGEWCLIREWGCSGGPGPSPSPPRRRPTRRTTGSVLPRNAGDMRSMKTLDFVILLSKPCTFNAMHVLNGSLFLREETCYPVDSLPPHIM